MLPLIEKRPLASGNGLPDIISVAQWPAVRTCVASINVPEQVKEPDESKTSPTLGNVEAETSVPPTIRDDAVGAIGALSAASVSSAMSAERINHANLRFRLEKLCMRSPVLVAAL